MTKEFDLNIEKILENWEVYHAVREIIANALDLRFKTPAFIGIDEIKVKKLGELTVITDIEHRTLYDILQGRNQKTLTEYFMGLRDREKVQWVCSDMYRHLKNRYQMLCRMQDGLSSIFTLL